MTKLVNQDCGQGFFKVILDIEDDGVDIYAYTSIKSDIPEWDYYVDDLETAKQFSFGRFGAKLESWAAL